MTEYHVKGSFSNVHNNPINTLTAFAGTHTRGAASPLCPTCLRPLLESYMPVTESNQFTLKLLFHKLLSLKQNSFKIYLYY